MELGRRLRLCPRSQRWKSPSTLPTREDSSPLPAHAQRLAYSLSQTQVHFLWQGTLPFFDRGTRGDGGQADPGGELGRGGWMKETED